MKRIKEGVNTFLIARVERIESIKDGAEVMSFKLKDNPPLRLRCALYIRVTCDDAHDEYQVGDEIVLMLKRLGYVPFDENMDGQDEAAEIPPRDEEVEEGFYEVEEVLGRRLRKDMSYEFQVRFKGYGPEDDMWLPASSFNRTVSFQTTSCFGRNRKHKTSKGSSAQIEPPTKKPPWHEPTQEKMKKRQDSKPKIARAKSLLTMQPRSKILQRKSCLNHNMERNPKSLAEMPEVRTKHTTILQWKSSLSYNTQRRQASNMPRLSEMKRRKSLSRIVHQNASDRRRYQRKIRRRRGKT